MSRPLKLSVAALLTLSAFSTAALAHPGHADGLAGGLAHPFTGVDHVLAMVAVGLWASQLGRRAMWLLPAAFPVVMVAGALLGMSGVTLPWAEAGIVASVVVLGLAVALRWQASMVVSVALVGVFALFHGYVHGVEMPATGSVLLYGIGFVAATVALHLIGLGIGVLAGRPVVLRTAGGAIACIGLLLVLAH